MRAFTALVTASLLVSTAASAVVVSFGGHVGSVPTFNAGVIDPISSVITNFTNKDGALKTEGFYEPSGGQTCAAYNSSIATYTGTDSYELQIDSVVGVRYKPTQSGTCYAVVNQSNFDPITGNPTQNRNPGSISININGIGDGISTPSSLLYAGFYWGSADSFNYVKFIDTSNKEIVNPAITYNGAAFGSGGGISGTDVNNALGPSTDREQFINFQFTAAEKVGAIEIGNTGGCCFEFTNYTDSNTAVKAPAAAVPAFSAFAVAVSEPGAAFALAAGLGMIGLARRRRA